MKIAITGASGHIGSNLCPLLIEKGHSLKILVYQSIKGLPTQNTEIVKGDLTNLEAVEKLIEGVDAVIHLAAKINLGKDVSGDIYKVNKLGSENVAAAAIKYKVKRLIYFSSIHTFNPFPLDEVLNETRELVGSGGSDYDKSKIAGELALAKARVHGVETIVICPTSVFGPNDHYPSLLGGAIIDIYNRKIPALIPAGYDFVDVRDVAKGAVLALENGVDGEKYILGGHYLTLKELAFKIGNVGKVKTTQLVIGIGILKLLLPFFKLEGKLKKKPPVFSRDSLKILSESNPHISSEKAVLQLGYRKTAVDNSIESTLRWFAKEGRIKF
jgi:dihydroflavonol-4-reductase